VNNLRGFQFDSVGVELNMKQTHNNTPHNGSLTNTKLNADIGSKSWPATHAWWVYRANETKTQNNPGLEILAPTESFPKSTPTRNMDAKRKAYSSETFDQPDQQEW